MLLGFAYKGANNEECRLKIKGMKTNVEGKFHLRIPSQGSSVHREML